MALDGKYGRVTTERGSIGENEPVVVFRARDALLPGLLEHYWHLCMEHGSPQRHLDLITGAIAEVTEWQAGNYTKVPTSDPPAG